MASHERREFDKYLKFLTSKSIQVVVQSHDGTKMKLHSNPDGTDWFNIVLNDNREIVSELRHSIDPPYPQDGHPVKVEITAETSEGESFLVEVWQIILDPRKRDVTVSVSHTLYPRLSLLLKSVLAVSRCIPSYQLSRKNDDLKFKYILSSGEPATLEGLKTVKLGESVGPFGAVLIILHYRTHFTSPERIPDFGLSLTDSQRTNKSNQSFPPLATDSSSTHNSASPSLPRPPFSTFLPKATQRMLSSEKNTPSEEGSLVPTNSQDSNEKVSVNVQSNNGSFIFLDMKPAFNSDDIDSHDVSELLQLCKDPPFLDMFYEGGMDVPTACSYLDVNLSLSAAKIS